MRRYLSAWALALAVTLGFAASGSTVSAAGVATSVLTQAPAQASAVQHVGYKHRHHYRPRVYFSYGAPRYYGYYGYYAPRPHYYYRKKHYRSHYHKKHRHHHHHHRRHYH